MPFQRRAVYIRTVCVILCFHIRPNTLPASLAHLGRIQLATCRLAFEISPWVIPTRRPDQSAQRTCQILPCNLRSGRRRFLLPQSMACEDRLRRARHRMAPVGTARRPMNAALVKSVLLGVTADRTDTHCHGTSGGRSHSCISLLTKNAPRTLRGFAPVWRHGAMSVSLGVTAGVATRRAPGPSGSELLKRRAIAQPHTHIKSPWADPFVPQGHCGGPNLPRVIASEMFELRIAQARRDIWEDRTNQVCKCHI